MLWCDVSEEYWVLSNKLWIVTLCNTNLPQNERLSGVPALSLCICILSYLYNSAYSDLKYFGALKSHGCKSTKFIRMSAGKLKRLCMNSRVLSVQVCTVMVYSISFVSWWDLATPCWKTNMQIWWYEGITS